MSERSLHVLFTPQGTHGVWRTDQVLMGSVPSCEGAGTQTTWSSLNMKSSWGLQYYMQGNWHWSAPTVIWQRGFYLEESIWCALIGKIQRYHLYTRWYVEDTIDHTYTCYLYDLCASTKRCKLKLTETAVPAQRIHLHCTACRARGERTRTLLGVV